MGVHLILLARAPVAGRVKTRLADALGPEGAARLHAAFTEDLAERLSGRFPLTLAVDADGDDAFFPPIAERIGATLAPQGPGDLGARMARALQAHLATGDAGALLIGTDLPTVPLGHLEAAARLLARHAVVLCPSADGGYWAVGAARRALDHWPEVTKRLFTGIEWGTPTVLMDTLARAGDLDIALGPAWFDVDEPRDLDLLIRHLASGADPALPRTRAVLTELGRL